MTRLRQHGLMTVPLFGLIRRVRLSNGGQGRKSDDGTEAEADHRRLVHDFTRSPKSEFSTLRAWPREAEWPVNARLGADTSTPPWIEKSGSQYKIGKATKDSPAHNLVGFSLLISRLTT
jgi:hypothetical protein